MRLRGGATGHNVEARRLLYERRYRCGRFRTAICHDKSSEKPGTLLSSSRGGKWQKSRQHDACALRRRVHVLLVLASFSPRKYGRNEEGLLIGSMEDA